MIFSALNFQDWRASVPLRSVYVFSSNPKKLGELRRVLGGVRVESLSEVVETLPDVVEDGDTFEANARKKALAGALAAGAATVADDSGLEVDALDGLPGVWSDRFAIRHGSLHKGADRAERTRANNELLLERLQSHGEPARTARFVCALCCAIPTDDFEFPIGESPGVHVEGGGAGWATITVRGTCEGRITANSVGGGGFGYDPLFWSNDLQKTFGSASAEEKQNVSHRGRAAEQLISFMTRVGIL